MQIDRKNYIKVCFKKTYYSFFHDTDIRKKRELLKVILSFVVPPGIEPGTQGFSVLCSTN